MGKYTLKLPNNYELKIRMSEPVFNIPLPAREVVVCDDDLMTFKH